MSTHGKKDEPPLCVHRRCALPKALCPRMGKAFGFKRPVLRSIGDGRVGEIVRRREDFENVAKHARQSKVKSGFAAL